jgi:hypothetical protein
MAKRRKRLVNGGTPSKPMRIAAHVEPQMRMRRKMIDPATAGDGLNPG